MGDGQSYASIDIDPRAGTTTLILRVYVSKNIRAKAASQAKKITANNSAMRRAS